MARFTTKFSIAGAMALAAAGLAFAVGGTNDAKAPGIQPGAGAPTEPGGTKPPASAGAPAAKPKSSGLSKGAPGGAGGDHNDMPVSIGPPAAAVDAANRYFGDATREIHKELQDGETWWAATGTKDDQHIAIRMTETGDIVQVMTMLPLDEMPAAIRNLIKRANPTAKFERVTQIQTTCYDVTLLLDGRTRHVKVYANGSPVASPESGESRQASAERP